MNLLFKLLSTGLTIGAGIAANKVLDAAWERGTGKRPPKDLDDPENSLRAALTFAVVSAAVAAVIHVLAGRGASHAAARFKKNRDEV
ncbi:DUF4235 domain-containing protein [Paenarthrobacter sp. DKR-5]|uniref:DUF4235 domain-containing protein n=1 Tax=Paenarthrobacter sp. DKR-5 TaxID=2835535 RepID=UPI001BDC9A9F|nr:DUF4235 domain-containing protein [Paenarthrobacter sp. DKR-5]MBT1001435.1 DUF4235 domain-containing protein [Paenarthrobacter sp. DKR-5]